MYRALLCALLFCCGIASSKAQVAPEDQPATVDKSSSARVGERQECKARIAANNMRRLALIIGNDRTKHFRIQNGVNDTRLVAATLNGIGFDVVALYDLSHAQMLSALALFSDKIKELCQNDIVVFYYAGNGEEINRMGFIATTDSEIPSDPSTEREKLSKWVNLKQILDSIQIHQGPKIVILDTCRTVPLAAHRKFQPPVYVGDFRIPKSTLIAYATEPGLEAQDGLPGEKNGPPRCLAWVT